MYSHRMYAHRYMRLIKSIQVNPSISSLSPLSGCISNLVRLSKGIRLYSEAGKHPALVSTEAVLQPCEPRGRAKFVLTPRRRAYIEKQRQAGFPNLRIESSRKAGFPSLVKAREIQREAGFPNLSRGRKTHEEAGYPGLRKGLDTWRTAGFPELKRGRETNRISGHLGLQKGHETLRKNDYNGLKRFKIKQRAEQDAQRARQGLPPKRRLQFPCPRCDKVYESKKALRRHDAGVHEGLRHRCSFAGCGKLYSTFGGLKKHLRTVHD